MEREAPSPWAARLGHLAFAVILAIVIARCLMLESIRSAGDFSAGLAPVRSPGAAVSIVLDWLSFVPVLLVLARRTFDRSRPLHCSAAHVLLALLAIWSLASVAWADDKFLALISAARIAGGAALFWATTQLVTRFNHLRVVVGLVVGILLVNVLQGLYYQQVDLPDLKQYWMQNREQIFAQRGWRPDDYMAQRFELRVLAGEMLNFSVSANVLGALVVSAALVAFAAGMQRWEDKDDRGWAGAMFITGLGSAYVLAYTGSKASWAALVIGATLLVLWRITRRWITRHRRGAFLLCLAAVTAGAAAIIAYGLTRGGLPSDSLNFRWRYWIGAWRMFLERPLLGVGWGNFSDFYLAHRLPQATEEIQDPHSFPVRWATELGIVGLVIGLAWLAAWAWGAMAALSDSSPSPGTPGGGRGEGLEGRESSGARALTLTLSQSTGRGDRSRMPISGVLLALLLAFALTLVCTLDVSDASYAILEIFRRFVHIGIIALAIGIVCIGRREAADERMTVDDRPAPWLAAGLFVGVVMMLVQSTIDIALFQPGPWALVMVMMGAVIGLTKDASTRDATPSPVFASQSTPENQRRRCVAATAIAAVAWLAVGGGVVLRIVIAEQYASLADAARARRDVHNTWLSAQYASHFSPVANFDYLAREAEPYEAEVRRSNGDLVATYTPRALFDRAIAAAPHHPMSWLNRSRWLVSQKTVSTEDAQQAIDDFARAIELNPNEVDLRLEYADLLERFGHQLSAAEQLEAALAIDDQLDPKEPERLELRSPGKYEAIRQRAAALRGEKPATKPLD